MEAQPIAVLREIHAVSPEGVKHEVTLTVLMPSRRERGGWLAPVQMMGLENRVHNIAGMDSWQALTLAMRFAGVRLAELVEKGWCLYWDDGTPFLMENF